MIKIVVLFPFFLEILHCFTIREGLFPSGNPEKKKKKEKNSKITQKGNKITMITIMITIMR